MVKKTIEIHEEHEEYLENNPGVNLSGAVREMIEGMMDE